MTGRTVFVRSSDGPPVVDERIVLDDRGRACLVVLRPATDRDRVGVWDVADGPDLDVLLAGDSGGAVVRVAAERLLAARSEPRAVLGFATAVASGGATTLAVVAAGTESLEWELDPAQSAVHFAGTDGQPLSWQPLPGLPGGFVTADAVDLGGVRRTARLDPGTVGALAFEVPVPEGARHVSIQVLGWLHVPGLGRPERFEARTAPAPL